LVELQATVIRGSWRTKWRRRRFRVRAVLGFTC